MSYMEIREDQEAVEAVKMLIRKVYTVEEVIELYKILESEEEGQSTEYNSRTESLQEIVLSQRFLEYMRKN